MYVCEGEIDGGAGEALGIWKWRVTSVCVGGWGMGSPMMAPARKQGYAATYHGLGGRQCSRKFM